MDFIEKSIEMRTVKREELINYFVKIGGNKIENETLSGEGWQAEIGQETPAFLGSFMLPEIKVTIRARKEIFNKFYDDFKMAFLRAGG